MADPITLDLQVVNQTINTDIESVAPLRNFNPDEAYDVANSTITATVIAPEEKVYRLVLAADVEAESLAATASAALVVAVLALLEALSADTLASANIASIS